MKQTEYLPFLRKDIVGPQISAVKGTLMISGLLSWLILAAAYAYLNRADALSFTQILFLGPVWFLWELGQIVGFISPTAEPTWWAISWRLLLLGTGVRLWLNQPVSGRTYVHERQEAHRRLQGRWHEAELAEQLSIPDDQMVLAHAYRPHHVSIGLSWQTPGHVLCVGEYAQRHNQLSSILLRWTGTAVIFDPWGKLYESSTVGRYWSQYFVPDTPLYLPVTSATEKIVHELLLWQQLKMTEAEMNLARLLGQIVWQYSQHKKIHPLVVWGDMAVGDPLRVWQTLADFRPDAMPRLLGDFPPEQWWHGPVAPVYEKICQRWQTYRPYLPLFTTPGLPDDWTRQNNRLFITFSPDDYANMAPLLHSWLTLFCQARPGKQRILFLIPYLAELAFPYLTWLLKQITHWGGRCVAGIDSIDQLETTYGAQGAENLLAGFSHSVWSTPQTPKTAQYMSQQYGTMLTFNWLTPNPLAGASTVYSDPPQLGWALYKEAVMPPEAMRSLAKTDLLLMAQTPDRHVAIARQPIDNIAGNGGLLLPTSSFNPQAHQPLTVKWGIAQTARKRAARSATKSRLPARPEKSVPIPQLPAPSRPTPPHSPPSGQLALPLGATAPDDVVKDTAVVPKANVTPEIPEQKASAPATPVEKKVAIKDLF